MKFLLRHRLVLLVTLLLLSATNLVACAPDPDVLIISPQLGEQMAAIEAGNQVVVAEPTPLPKLADLAPEAITAGLPPEFEAALATANPDEGVNIATANGCIGCHSLDPTAQMTGPTWYGVGNTAVSRVPGESPALYLYQSITDSGAFVAPGYPAGIMPAIYGDTLSEQQIADMVAYLLSQTQE